MGNNLAPTLAIIYVNELDSQILEKSNGCVTLKRFIDDYFVFLLSRQITSDELLTTANDLNDTINFTFELPKNNQLPFLDTVVTFNSDIKTFSTTLYAKLIRSRCISPWDSHGPIALKQAILIGEIKRAVTCSTDSVSPKKSLGKITELFFNNEYPRKFVKAVIRRTLSSVTHRSGIDNIKIHFMNGRPSSRVFAPLREKPNCSDDCETCKLAIKPNHCLTKKIVYEIRCSI